ncbi:MAG TPA: hypothetical protein VH813_11275 [Candidatus Limnocylindrales bacterium]
MAQNPNVNSAGPAAPWSLDSAIAARDHGPSIFRQPARFLVLAGAIAALAGSPWTWAYPIDLPLEIPYTGLAETSDGFLIGLAAVIMLVLATSRSAATSTTRAVQMLPVIVGSAVVLLAVGAVQTAERHIAHWEHLGGSGAIHPWLTMIVVGSAMMALGGAWISLRDSRRYRPAPSVDPPLVTPANVVRAVAGVVATALGAFAGLEAALALWSDNLGSLPLLIGLVGGGLLGMLATDRVATRIQARR